MNSYLLFISVVALTFLSGFQNKNVVGSHYLLASLTSMLLGMAGILLYKVMPTATPSEMAAYVLAGPIGITLSMLTHDKLVGKSVSRKICNRCAAEVVEENHH